MAVDTEGLVVQNRHPKMGSRWTWPGKRQEAHPHENWNAGATSGRDSSDIIYKRPTAYAMPAICHSSSHIAEGLTLSGDHDTGWPLCHPGLWLVSLLQPPWTGAVPRALEEKDGLGFLPGVLGFDLLV